MRWRSLLRPAAAAYLVLVLLLAPLLGLMHGVIHFHDSSPPSATGRSAAVQAQAHTHKHGLVDLFAGHGEASDCRVYDQLACGDGVPESALPALPLLLSAFVFLLLAGEVLARRAALFQARAPPLAR